MDKMRQIERSIYDIFEYDIFEYELPSENNSSSFRSLYRQIVNFWRELEDSLFDLAAIDWDEDRLSRYVASQHVKLCLKLLKARCGDPRWVAKHNEKILEAVETLIESTESKVWPLTPRQKTKVEAEKALLILESLRQNTF